MDGGLVDELMNARLRAQELALRDVISTVTRLRQHGAALGSGPGWIGAASAAFDTGVDGLRAQLQNAHAHLIAALQDTASAVVSVAEAE